MGVHAAISVPGVSDQVPPEYVPRDVDAAEFGVRARVAAAAERGGFVLLVGGSSVGKTRSAFEAVKSVLPDWWLIHPAGSAKVALLAQAPVPRMVLWLDELQRYLDGEHGLTGGLVRALLSAPDPVVIVGTLWPDRYAVPGVRVVDHQQVAAGTPGHLVHQRPGLLQGGPDQVGGGDLAQVPGQEPELGVDAGDSFSCPGLAGTRPAGEYQVLPRCPADRRAGRSAGLFRAQDGDRSGELLADGLQTRKAGQAAHVALAVLV
jgi:hypothetical protein